MSAVIFDDPAAAFADPSLRATYQQAADGMQSGAAVIIPNWLAADGPSLIVPLRDAERTPEEVATDFMTVYPAP